MHYKVKENKSLVRDSYSRAIINTNIREYESAKLAAERANKNAQLAEDVETLKQDIEHIKQMLETIVGRNNGGSHS